MVQFQIFWEYVKQYMKARLAYRLDLVVKFLTDLISQSFNLIFIIVVFGHTKQLGGWNQAEVVFIYGYFLLPWAIFGTFFNLWSFNDRYIIKGELDRVLTRPVHSLLQIIMESMTPESLIGVVTGLAVMGYGASQLNLDWAWYDSILMILFTLGGVLVYGGIFIALTSISLYTDSKTDIQPIVFNVSNYGRYPVNIYSRFVQFVLTWILPFAFVGFYPASFLLDRGDWRFYAYITPVVGLVYFSIAVLLWNRGIRHYRGAGN
ncbi:ABC-2 family transporter protein [Shimazuella sp. AN120528]|uniref:ABC transporter permease n=1 Tax=Shimazuella soli TaxID=1892854 RepID=UPI001F0CF628|nr:ABC-2 family transporter protein [Shimazuella soli]MCH5586558.1 ABC-2 family transporter protein [Shimazuella soli]